MNKWKTPPKPLSERKSKTQQQFKDECNINNIINKFKQTGMVTHGNTKTPIYGDFSDHNDYHASLIKIQEAKEQFMELPAKIRHRFQNNPQKLIEFINNASNKAEAIELGIISSGKIDPQTALLQKIAENTATEVIPPK